MKSNPLCLCPEGWLQIITFAGALRGNLGAQPSGLGERPAGLGKLLSSSQTLGTLCSRTCSLRLFKERLGCAAERERERARASRSDSDGLVVIVGLQQNLSTKRGKGLQSSAILCG